MDGWAWDEIFWNMTSITPKTIIQIIFAVLRIEPSENYSQLTAQQSLSILALLESVVLA